MKSLSASISLWISLWRTNRFEDNLSMDLSMLSPSACATVRFSFSRPSIFRLDLRLSNFRPTPLRPLHHLSFPNPAMCRLVLYSSCPAIVWNKSFRFLTLFAFCFWVLDLAVRCVVLGFRVLLGLYCLCLCCPVFYSPTCASRYDSHSTLLRLSVCLLASYRHPPPLPDMYQSMPSSRI